MIITSQTLQVGGVVSFYMSAALVMVFVNKAVLNNSPDMPLLFLMIQLLIAVVLLHASASISKRIEIPQWDMQTAKKLVPVVLVNIVGLVFNTLCLRDVEASFFQIARGLVLPLTVVVSSTHTHTTPSKKVLLSTAIVTIGFLLGVAPSASVPATAAPSLLSLFYGVLSSFFIAMHAVLIKISLPYCNNSTIQLAWWTNVGSAIFLLPALLFHQEHSIMYSKLTSGNWNASVFIWGSIVTGVFGFLLCVAGLLSIKVTSPITHMFSSAARSVLQTLLGVWIFNDLLNVNRASSILVILGGTMLYTWIKSNETAPPAPPRPPIDLESMGGDKTTGEEEDTLVWELPEKYAEGKD